MVKLQWFTSVLLMMLAGSSLAQSTLHDSDWTQILSNDKDFFVYLPDGYKMATEGTFYLPGTGGSAARVDSVARLGRLVNGGAIIVEYYSGDAKGLQDIVEERSACLRVDTREVQGFALRFFQGESKGIKCRGVSARRKNSLYVVQSYSSNAEALMKALFDSIRVIEQGTTRNTFGVAATSVLLPRTLENLTPVLSDAGPIEESEADRKPILLATPRPRNLMPSSRTGPKVKVAVKVLLTASGDVTVISVEKGSKIYHATAQEAAQKLVFIPAEKGGKVVSVYKTMEYSF